MRTFNFKAWLMRNKSLLLIIVAIFALRWSVLDHYRVPSGSMIPTIEIGDDIFVSKLTYQIKIPFTEINILKLKEVESGEIVVFASPTDGINYVKRVIGVPGDTLVIKDGLVWRNGTLLGQGEGRGEFFYEETWPDFKVKIRREEAKFRPREQEIILTEGQYFMMGDNRDNSFDSRYFGIVDRSLIKGKVYFVMWSFSLDNPFPYFKFKRTGHYFY